MRDQLNGVSWISSLPEMQNALQQLASNLHGDLHYDALLRTIYATDASVYRELPLAVAIPKNEADLKKLIRFANKHKVGLIPRAAGTSLAGQCVGDGIVVDISKHFTKIIELNVEERWVRVQPGVIRDELNAYLKPHGLWFGPNTSTANRCMIGGMVGNNSSGTTSIKYGVTRDHLREMKVLLSDGSEATFSGKASNANNGSLQNKVEEHLLDELSKQEVQQRINEQFPKPEIHRRNTGYAVDMLLLQQPFDPEGDPFNLCSLLCGSEGTLAFTTEITLDISPLPPQHQALIAAHFQSVDEALRAVQIVMKHEPYACELMDKIILDCTKENKAQAKNREFVDGDPAALLMMEVRGEKLEDVGMRCELKVEELKAAGLGYAFPILEGDDINKAWELRKAGLGLLANLPGDAKGVACIEDTAVTIEDLPNYIADFTAMMDEYGQKAVYYAHAGAGEIHLRPILDLKRGKDVELFRTITRRTAELVKKYDGSLSGEHGDGRVRAEFLPMMIGEENLQLLLDIKRTWDPNNTFNPGKIIDAPPMDTSLRYEVDRIEPDIKTLFDFGANDGILRAAEKCNGSGDCRKVNGGTMCPSYRATRDEKDTTRARANVLREFLTRNTKDENPFAHEELKEVMDLCLSCKACASECPSNVDMATMKAEFQHQYQKQNGVPFRSKLIANNAKLNSLASKIPWIANPIAGSAITKSITGIASQRSVPKVLRPLEKWFNKNKPSPQVTPKGSLYFFNDEFTRYLDTTIGIIAINLLTKLGYEVKLIDHAESARAHISKGLLTEAQKLARRNVAIFKDIVSEGTPLIGIEPSCILGFRDEYPKLVEEKGRAAATQLGENALMIDEFLYREMMLGNITSDQFDAENRSIKLHGHCHQKALSDVSMTAHILSLPTGHSVEMIPSGCCGMAGSFGYEKEHYEVSMKIGEDVLFPAVRKASKDAIIAAPGTSCRHHIMDGTQRQALHPVEILYEALKK